MDLAPSFEPTTTLLIEHCPKVLKLNKELFLITICLNCIFSCFFFALYYLYPFLLSFLICPFHRFILPSSISLFLSLPLILTCPPSAFLMYPSTMQLIVTYSPIYPSLLCLSSSPSFSFLLSLLQYFLCTCPQSNILTSLIRSAHFGGVGIRAYHCGGLVPPGALPGCP